MAIFPVAIGCDEPYLQEVLALGNLEAGTIKSFEVNKDFTVEFKQVL